MNRFENWFCGSSFWRAVTRKEVLPWLLTGTALGEHVLEIGAGAGAATAALRRHAPRVTSLEYSEKLLSQLARQDMNGGRLRNGAVLRGDAAALPFANETFSAVIAVLMLHHLGSREGQAQVLQESFRVLRPGGVFLALEIENGWLNRIAHIRSTFLPMVRAEVPARLGSAGFHDVTTARRRGAFRIRALR